MSTLPPQPSREPRIPVAPTSPPKGGLKYAETENFTTVNTPIGMAKIGESARIEPPVVAPPRPTFSTIAPTVANDTRSAVVTQPKAPVVTTKSSHKESDTVYPIYLENAESVVQGKDDAFVSSLLGGAGIVTLLTGILGPWFFFVPFVLSGMALAWARKAKRNGNAATLGRVLGWIGIGTAVVGVLVVGLITGIATAILTAIF